MLFCAQSLSNVTLFATPWIIICQAPLSMGILDSSGKNTGVGCLALVQWIFPTQESNRGLLQLGWTLYHQSHQGRLGIVMFHQKYFSYFCFNYFDIFINVFSRIYFLLCLTFKHFCPNDFNLYLLKVWWKVGLYTTFPYKLNILQISYLYFLAYYKNWHFNFSFPFLLCSLDVCSFLDSRLYYLLLNSLFCKSSFNLYISLFFPVYHRF